MEHLDEMLNSRKEGVLLVLGVDNFKNINTKYGRGHGNFILKRIAALLENSIDENIKIYRLDGDRFAVNFVGYDMEAVREVYQNIQMKMMENCTFQQVQSAIRCPESRMPIHCLTMRKVLWTVPRRAVRTG